MLQRFKQKRVIVTGGASGLGQALVMRFARLGWKIAIADIDRDGAEQVATLAEQMGASATRVFYCNIGEDSDFAYISEELKTDWGGVDIIINNAGIASCGWLHEVDTTEWQRVMNLNLSGPFRGCHFWVPLLPENGPAHIVNVASFAGIALAPGMLTYNVSKASVIALSEALRMELAHRDCGVSVICPSFFKTNLLDSVPRATEKMLSTVQGLMESSNVTADDVADDIIEAIERKRFMVVSHQEVKKIHLVKRFLPELFYRKGVELAAKMMARGQGSMLKDSK